MTNSIALVTGASSGIGRAAAQALAEAGYTVVGTSRNAGSTTPIKGVELVDLDVSSDESVNDVVAQVVERHGRIDVLVNNAGIGGAGAAEETSVDQAQRIFDTNVFGVIRTTRAVLPHMRAQGGGRIINVSSVLGFIPAPYMAVYAATKHAVEGYSESLDHEVRQYGVRVLLIQPGYTKTGFEANAMGPDSPLPVYADQRQVFDQLMATSMEAGDDPAIVAAAIVEAATDRKPRLRYRVGSLTKRIGTLRRIAPAGAFDKQIHKYNRLPA